MELPTQGKRGSQLTAHLHAHPSACLNCGSPLTGRSPLRLFREHNLHTQMLSKGCAPRVKDWMVNESLPIPQYTLGWPPPHLFHQTVRYFFKPHGTICPAGRRHVSEKGRQQSKMKLRRQSYRTT